MSNSLWHTAPQHDGLVAIPGTGRHIHTWIAGPVHSSTSPLVILEYGIGGSAVSNAPMANLISQFARVLWYERAGYGDSTPPPPDEPLTAETRARDLSRLLEAINLKPPYVLVGHSFGGVYVREFLRQRGSEDVVGMVLVDAIPLSQQAEELDDILAALCGSDDPDAYPRAIGLLDNVVLTPEQDAERQRCEKIATQNKTLMREAVVAIGSQMAVNEAEGAQMVKGEDGFVTELRFTKKSLGKGKLAIVIGDFPADFEKAIAFARARDFEDDAVYAQAEQMVALAKATVTGFQEAQASLTEGEVRIKKAEGKAATHNLQLVAPEMVAAEVKWIVGNS